MGALDRLVDEAIWEEQLAIEAEVEAHPDMVAANAEIARLEAVWSGEPDEAKKLEGHRQWRAAVNRACELGRRLRDEVRDRRTQL